MHDILDTLEQWLAQDRNIALATVVSTWGSSPRQAGAKMGIESGMGMIGSVSSGCVETAVASEALASLADRRPRLLNFGVTDDDAWDIGLTCGGKLSVYVEPLDSAWWKLAAARARQDRAFATVTVVAGELAGQKALIDADGVAYATDQLQPEHCAEFLRSGQAGIEAGAAGRQTIAGLDALVDVHLPAPKLIIVGGAHVALALNRLAQVLGFRVYLVDPRSAFATPERFPNAAQISHLYPDKVLPDIGMTAQTCIAILTHDPKIDDPALRVALPSPAAYIGVLSSKRTHQKRIERLTAGGLDPALLARIHTPIGLDIGASTPEEIALAILAEIVAVRNKH